MLQSKSFNHVEASVAFSKSFALNFSLSFSKPDTTSSANLVEHTGMKGRYVRQVTHVHERAVSPTAEQ